MESRNGVKEWSKGLKSKNEVKQWSKGLKSRNGGKASILSLSYKK